MICAVFAFLARLDSISFNKQEKFDHLTTSQLHGLSVRFEKLSST